MYAHDIIVCLIHTGTCFVWMYPYRNLVPRPAIVSLSKSVHNTRTDLIHSGASFPPFIISCHALVVATYFRLQHEEPVIQHSFCVQLRWTSVKQPNGASAVIDLTWSHVYKETRRAAFTPLNPQLRNEDELRCGNHKRTAFCYIRLFLPSCF
jgi:hypothetical protein